ncbi:hypothetical protein E1281_13320 [Actinomadura sp. KC345]|uniref:permease-like cell division protein FtsX n=1 Tax=Actinomadura sp. KC345 TaxID=2530371 RepID=UPI00104AD6E3|nr:permease-like cell division protein FtsX [Actinomadura sp. KC345]TDC55303.1 hypothetical protein E1281_13320 [Actinomadura sp. KC345]
MSGPEDERYAAGGSASPRSPEGRGAPRSRTALIAVVVAVSVVLAGALATGGYLVVNRILDEADDSTAPVERRVSVFFCTTTSRNPGCGQRDATEQEQRAARKRLDGMPEVRRIEYESKEQAYERLKRTFKDREDMVESVGPGDLADSLQLWAAGTGAAETVKAAATGLPGVDRVVILPHSSRA